MERDIGREGVMERRDCVCERERERGEIDGHEEL